MYTVSTTTRYFSHSSLVGRCIGCANNTRLSIHIHRLSPPAACDYIGIFPAIPLPRWLITTSPATGLRYWASENQITRFYSVYADQSDQRAACNLSKIEKRFAVSHFFSPSKFLFTFGGTPVTRPRLLLACSILTFERPLIFPTYTSSHSSLSIAYQIIQSHFRLGGSSAESRSFPFFHVCHRPRVMNSMACPPIPASPC